MSVRIAHTSCGFNCLEHSYQFHEGLRGPKVSWDFTSETSKCYTKAYPTSSCHDIVTASFAIANGSRCPTPQLVVQMSGEEIHCALGS